MSQKSNTCNTTFYQNEDFVNELVKDPRRPLSEMAKSLGTYRQKVWRKIKELEEKRVVWGYTAVVDEERMGWKSFIILMKMEPISEKQAQLLIRRVLEQEAEKLKARVVDSFYMNGAYDWIIIFAADSWATARKYYDSIRKEYKAFLTEKPELIDIVFPITRYGKINPDMERIMEFVPP
ncbi:MAG: winged helix-turn-helix transcriptional regulator [Theionarchaea archaeon]|nr:winged helix-turn-helix transcriptional regulator [Theionarchaea archaeon]MBU6999384.1 winged helix-turn-helix transcriptional regulator [Theionarchaea archaeon]MBU7021350.1 winged helix-turn-helix transcriptional regulator [Theionarchaea archaeon]MBU7035927.1 winged helix-turn-helix transcriptional regulator [Theionarchaea archaeon]MBU7041577.1 winged helix-turn-helix transcriptional regulator [Theionarchaea archaeon]